MLRYFDKILIVCACLLLSPTIGEAQKAMDDDRIWIKADRALELGDYIGALQLYEQLYAKDSSSQDLQFKLGVCNFEIRRLRRNASKYFEKVSPVEYLETSYYLGRLRHLAGDYELAIAHYETYNDAKGFKAFTEDEIDDLIGKSKTAIIFEEEADKSILIKNLGNSVNSEYPEYAPLIPTAENVLYFTSRRPNEAWQSKDPLGDYFEDIYSSQRIDNAWQAPTMLDTTINTAMHDACTGLSADGQRLLFFRTSANLLTGNIFQTTNENEQWQRPVKLESVVNSEDAAETSACYAPDGDVIFFSSNRPGGYGGKDIYVVKKLPTGDWGIPYNLGPTINTKYNEDAPFVHPSGSELYFSSEGHQNMGGYDIFKSEFDETGHFSEAKNLGHPINTNDDDIFFVMNTDASTGYMSSERADGFGGHDIYAVHFSGNETPLHIYNIHAFGSDNSSIAKFEITLFDAESEAKIGKYKSNKKNGKMIVISERNKKYKMVIKAAGYETQTIVTTLDNEHHLKYTLTSK